MITFLYVNKIILRKWKFSNKLLYNICIDDIKFPSIYYFASFNFNVKSCLTYETVSTDIHTSNIVISRIGCLSTGINIVDVR